MRKQMVREARYVGRCREYLNAAGHLLTPAIATYILAPVSRTEHVNSGQPALLLNTGVLRAWRTAQHSRVAICQ